MTQEKGGVRCPSCGKSYTEDMIVGKTQTFNQGIRTTYNVISCECGRTYRGDVVGQKRLPKRDFRRKPVTR